MMENVMKTFSGSRIGFHIDQNLEVLLNIKAKKYGISCDTLFKMAARKNVKREFLFVSRVIGKHMPMLPDTLKIIGAILARCWMEERYGIISEDIPILVQALNDLQDDLNVRDYNTLGNLRAALSIMERPLKLKDSTLFIGFAETATGIAQAIFSNFSNAAYIHTTRENITTISPSLEFKEEHSHATDHLMYPINPKVFNEYEEIVLIDDELTTGKSALNLIENLPAKSFGIISILDWRSEDDIGTFNKIKGRNIKVCSLIKGELEFRKMGELNFREHTPEIPQNAVVSHEDIFIKSGSLIEGYLEYTGRFGMSWENQQELAKEIREIGELLKKEKIDGNCLCLGTGEFIYLPCMISAELGENVFFQSTTRSPIYVKDIPGYAITSKVEFKSLEKENVPNYLYNIPKSLYSQVFLFSEKQLSEEKKQEFKDIFNYFNIRNIRFVSWAPI